MKNVTFAIRDDDTSYWTKVEEIESLYGEWIKKGYKVSLATVPEAYNHNIQEEKFYMSDEKKLISENKELVNYLKEHIKNKNIEIMLHGYDHSYHVEFEDGKREFLNEATFNRINQKNMKYKLLPELIHKDYERVKKELSIGKQILEDTFNVKVNTFVPPGNALNKNTAKAVIENNLNICGRMEREFNRPFNIYSFINYLKIFKEIYIKKEINFNEKLDYKTHKEIEGFDVVNEKKHYETLKKAIEQKGTFIFATHYWELLSDSKKRKEFEELMESIKFADKKTIDEILKVRS